MAETEQQTETQYKAREILEGAVGKQAFDGMEEQANAAHALTLLRDVERHLPKADPETVGFLGSVARALGDEDLAANLERRAAEGIVARTA
jgi:hypothetical protein